MQNSRPPAPQHQQMQSQRPTWWSAVGRMIDEGAQASQESRTLRVLHAAHSFKTSLLLGALGIVSVGVSVAMLVDHAWLDAVLVGALAVAALIYSRKLLREARREVVQSSINDHAV